MEIEMIIANNNQIDRFTGKAAYASGAFHDATAAAINAEVVAATNGKLPCYVARIGARGAKVWVSVGSSARIGKGEAARMLHHYDAASFA